MVSLSLSLTDYSYSTTSRQGDIAKPFEIQCSFVYLTGLTAMHVLCTSNAFNFLVHSRRTHPLSKGSRACTRRRPWKVLLGTVSGCHEWWVSEPAGHLSADHICSSPLCFPQQGEGWEDFTSLKLCFIMGEVGSWRVGNFTVSES